MKPPGKGAGADISPSGVSTGMDWSMWALAFFFPNRHKISLRNVVPLADLGTFSPWLPVNFIRAIDDNDFLIRWESLWASLAHRLHFNVSMPLHRYSLSGRRGESTVRPWKKVKRPWPTVISCSRKNLMTRAVLFAAHSSLKPKTSHVLP